MAVSFDFKELSERERYKLMIGTIIPRPIALVTTVDEHGRINAAPFSFFNCLSADPPILAIGVENNADMSFKDTGHNIRMTEVFTVNIVSFAIAEAMHVCGARYPRGVDELKQAGLTAMPGERVASPYIAEAPAAFECRRHVTLELGRSRQIIMGEIVMRITATALSIRKGCMSIRPRSTPLRGSAAILAPQHATVLRC